MQEAGMQGLTGIAVDAGGFEVVVAGQRLGSRRSLDAEDTEFLEGLARKYQAATRSRKPEALIVVGRELWMWLEGDQGQLTRLLNDAGAPLIFEIRGPLKPTRSAWAMLNAPWELLAEPTGGFLAHDALNRFSVVRRLGSRTPPPAPGPYRLGLAFMASAPRGQQELDFEAEEWAIMQAVGQTRVDLFVDDSGDPEQLRQRLADLAGVGGVPVVHLSCHGTNRYPGLNESVLMMEDGLGGDRPTTASQLAQLLTYPPRLLFVSACLTGTAAAAEEALAHSFASAIVTAGLPAVVAWDGSVGDQAATVFAQRLYDDIANGADLGLAVGDARRRLLNSPDEHLRADWHLARVWLGAAGGGPIVMGKRKRLLHSATKGTKTFFDRKEKVPVADASMFVGRRRELQRALRALAAGERGGVLLHGQGRLGKSSLAARIADRRPDFDLAVVFGDYSALGILDAIADAVKTNPAARELIEQSIPRVRDEPEAIRPVLIDLLSGPCAQADGSARPLLLVIDDLEQILQPDPSGGPHSLVPDHAGVLAAVVGAFDPDETDSRLLVTSRYTFTLNDLERRLETVQLPPLSPVAQRKLHDRERARVSEPLRVERAALAERAIQVARGNPGLQDLVCLRLTYGESVPVERAETTISEMEAYLNRGDLPGDAEVRALLENLALDSLLDEAGRDNVELLRALTLFDLPVPTSVVKVLAEATGGDLARLLGLALADPHPDPYVPTREAWAANPLAAGRLKPLTAAERRMLAGRASQPLVEAWGGSGTQAGRDGALDVQLTRIGLTADDPTTVAATAADAVLALRSRHSRHAATIGQEAIALLDRVGHPVPVALARFAALAALTSGDGAAGDQLLARAAALSQDGQPLDQARVTAERARRFLTSGDLKGAEASAHEAHQQFKTSGSELEATIVMGVVADIHYQRGNYDEALRILTEVALPVYEQLGDIRSAAVTWGQVADIHYQRGNYDEALRIRTEVALPVFEQLGDIRSAAVTWGKVADIHYQRGNYDEALRILTEVALPVYEQLGDIRSAAVTWGKVADIHYQRGNYDEALRIRTEVELPVYEQLGDIRSAAVTWGQVADIHYQRGNYDEALRILTEVALPVYEQLGDIRSAAVTWGQVADIHYQRGNYDEALRIRTEVELPVYDQLGDIRSAAVTWGQVADIHYQRGNYDEALRILTEVALPVYEQLGDIRSAAVTWGQVADIHYQRGNYDEALRIHTEVALPVYEQLGDIRSAAVTWGQVADIHYQRGNYDEALRIHTEVALPVYDQLGDIRSAAVTWGQVADIHYQRGNYDEALRIHTEVALPVYEQLGDIREEAATWGKVADIHQQRGNYDEALRIHTEVALPVFEQLGDIRSAAVTWGKVADIHYQRGNYDEALRIHTEVALPVHEEISNVDGVANTCWGLARIYLARGDVDAALPLLIRSFKINRDLQRPDGIAVVGEWLGTVLARTGDPNAEEVLTLASNNAAKIGLTDIVERIATIRGELDGPPNPS